MVALQLLNGRYEKAEAKKLLTDLVKAKIGFHENRIKTSLHSEEDIKHSENRVKQLQRDLQDFVKAIDENQGSQIDLYAKIEIN